jgi:hypothetical protein
MDISNKQIQEKLHEIENAIILRMADSQDMSHNDMLMAIKRIPELKAYYYQVRNLVIGEFSASLKKDIKNEITRTCK